MKRADEAKVHVSSGNIFADLGLPDADDQLIRSNIAIELRRLIKERKLSQTAAAKKIGISQPDLSHILRGRLRGYSVERLMRMLTALDQDVEIRSKPRSARNRPGRITFTPAAA
jgi:predicted XRE-type DNA-binding protein